MALISIEKALDILKSGDPVAIPTETVYGLAARIDDDGALDKIFKTKARPYFDPLIVHVENRAQAKMLAAEWTDVHELLAQEFWPGPLTLIAKKSERISSLITSGLDTVALRAPAHPVAQEILRRLGIALAAPSANRFGKTSPTTAEHVENEFAGKVAVVDGGPCEVGVESTVLSIACKENVWSLKILRPGGVSRGQIKEALKKSKIDFQLEKNVDSDDAKASPGTLKAHYQPAVPLIIVNGDKPKRDGEPHWLKLPDDPVEAARFLYAELHRLSDLGGWIAVKREPQHSGENWEAVWDRIERASTAAP
jgi:L-threonylcarbamoyladenylate synthase